ncbi:MAG: cytochrome c oxidase subunit II, partial [Alphaproteobacteria bacterium]|nr:cytochrome c oxidase subunit II [Alphaproteobacteria bacterium]
RINETWMRIEKEGVYYGQCSELCGTGHGYMPIEVRAVSQEEFDAWAEDARKEYAKAGDAPADEPPVRVASLTDAR